MKRHFKYIILTCLFLSGTLCGGQEPSAVKLVNESRELFIAGRYDESERVCREAIDVDPRFYPAYNILASIYLVQKHDIRGAMAYFRKSLLINPGQPSIYSKMGLLCDRSGETYKSIEYYQKGLEHVPEDVNMNRNLAVIYFFKLHDPGTALKYLRVVKKHDESTKTVFLTAAAHLLSGDKISTLNYVTRLRQEGDEYFAAYLEDLIKKVSRGDQINTGEIMSIYIRQSDDRIISGKEESGDTMNFFPAPETTTDVPAGGSTGIRPATIKARAKVHGGKLGRPQDKSGILVE